jgi:hypothetical protein
VMRRPNENSIAAQLLGRVSKTITRSRAGVFQSDVWHVA